MLPPRRSGFTLVEIVLAVGIFSFVVIGILGLMTTAMDSARLAAQDTILASVTTDKLTSLRSKPFLSLYDSFTINQPVITPGYYSADGTPLTTSAGALYQCDLTGVPEATVNGVASTRDTATYIRVLAKFSWPVAAAAASRSHFQISAKISRYD